MQWHFIDPETIDPKKSGLSKIWALKCGYFQPDDKINNDVRCFKLRGGWSLLTNLIEKHPVTGKDLKYPQWWIFAAIGEE